MRRIIQKEKQFLLVVLLWLCPIFLNAQNEVSREINSLKGIQAMGFSVNYEANVSLTQKGEIKITSLQQMGEQALKDGEITLISTEELKQSDQYPLLHMHINAMDVGRGLVPFSINLYFYQPIKLVLNRDLRTTASTWESGTLGIASYDRLQLIPEAAEGLLNEFITDYNNINR
ncbi:hypothetical protein [Fodinibius salsisoli]|uniref:DUF302 domain-containing protein n=1 Tax=Fodinibius salsisoli TaxID=2820877 RepID=A0ABT3PMD0_9BACT|nr:hypothetical protein [Fodinibius salsisoli]MCW9707069.1 hypothetical protein [Fodinibius salsisoli]